MKTKIQYTRDHIFLLDLETELRGGEICIDKNSKINVFADLRFLGLSYSKDEIRKILAYKKLNPDARDFDLPFLPEWEEYPVYDMAEDMMHKHPDFDSEGWSEYQNGRLNGIIDGFNKAIDLNKDKQFTLDDIELAIKLARQTDYYRDQDIDKPRHTKDAIVQQFQQSKMPKDFIHEVNTCIVCGNINKYSCEKIKICDYNGEYFELKTINTDTGKMAVGKWVF